MNTDEFRQRERQGSASILLAHFGILPECSETDAALENGLLLTTPAKSRLLRAECSRYPCPRVIHRQIAASNSK